jgi:hypothetical protein
MKRKGESFYFKLVQEEEEVHKIREIENSN